MNFAAIFAMLVASGVCSQSDFRGSDGSRLAVLVCPVVRSAPATPDATPEEEPQTAPSPGAAPVAPEAWPGRRLDTRWHG